MIKGCAGPKQQLIKRKSKRNQLVVVATGLTITIITFPGLTTTTTTEDTTGDTMVDTMVDTTTRRGITSPFVGAGVGVPTPGGSSQGDASNVTSAVTGTASVPMLRSLAQPLPTRTKELVSDKLSVNNIITDNNINIDSDINFEYQNSSETVSVKGRLRQCYEFWSSINSNSYILSVIKFGYKILFVSLPLM